MLLDLVEVHERSCLLGVLLLGAILWTGRLGGPNLPKPWIVVAQLDALVVEKHRLCLDSYWVIGPRLEVHEHAKVFAVVLVSLLHDIYTIDLAEPNFLEDAANAFFGDVEVNPWNAQTRLSLLGGGGGNT